MADWEARRELLDEIAQAIDRVALALASAGEAYELLDDDTADRLEQHLFRPLQAAYGGLQRTHSEFAGRHGQPAQKFAPRTAPAATHGPRAPIDDASRSAGEADALISELQDSFAPVEYGDAPLRAGLAEARRQLVEAQSGARELVRTLGR
jgi:hypothetical protein